MVFPSYYTEMPDPSIPWSGMIGFLVVAIVIAYEWFISGLVKFVGGDLPASLAEELGQ